MTYVFLGYLPTIQLDGVVRYGLPACRTAHVLDFTEPR